MPQAATKYVRFLRVRWPIIAILVIAAVVRFAFLDRGDVVSDEAFYAFRSVGYLDFIFAPDQPTPIELLNARPFWTYLSFHDAPPLAFIVERATLWLFGQNLWGVRFAFALAGVMAVWLQYLIGRRLSSERAGLAAALVMAVLTPAVWISRIGLLESLAIFFGLAAIWFFLRAIKTKESPPPTGPAYNVLIHYSERQIVRWLAVGVALGFAFLSKYTAFVLVPVFAGWLIWQRRWQEWRWFGLAVGVALVMFLPVIIYNLKLFEVTRHFDLQFSYLFGQKPAEWQRLPGKEEFGSVGERLQMFWPNLTNTFSPLALGAFLAAALASAVAAWREPRKEMAESRFLWLGLIATAALLVLIGPSYRFLTMLAPWLAALSGLWLSQWLAASAPWRYCLIGALLLIELVYSINTNIITVPIGRERWTFSRLAYDRLHWGYNDLEQYLVRLTAGRYPASVLSSKYQFVNELSRAAIVAGRKARQEKLALLIVYDASLSDKAALWSFHRRLVYGGWPVVTVDAFNAVGGDEFFRKQGIEKFVFFKGEGDILRSHVPPGSAVALADDLSARGIKPKTLASNAGVTRLNVWEF
ncbi:glycosyltransferase family 39 protein [Candidatus Parcubacteria bacterium]|nr:glycosyltransferase family 39 protein [Candidatus Parcubacteria bacterium]